MLAGLRACSHQVSQPSWGLGGPHDAGAYTVWPQQTGFFNQYGNWSECGSGAGGVVGDGVVGTGQRRGPVSLFQGLM